MRTGHPAAQHLSLDDPLGGGPIDDACMLELAEASAAAERPTSRHILGIEVTQRKK